MSLARLSICAHLLGCIALAAGCRSGVERDVVQRELRQQEDQIYALEDYLTEYQQLLCDARAQNSALKRQLAKEQFHEGSANRIRGDADSLPSPPAIAPTPPAGSNASEPDQIDVSPDVPPLDLEAPAVPPLDMSSEHAPSILAARGVVPASAEIEVVPAPPATVILRGEVQVDSVGSESAAVGPRVLLSVQPVDADGEPVRFDGQMSLLVLDPAAPVKERQLARWDFDDEELAGMATAIHAKQVFELPLQLPVESPTNRPLELWVRLLPEDGEKILGNTTLDVSRSGQFASAEMQPKNKQSKRPQPQVVPAAAEVPVIVKSRSHTRVFDTNVEQCGWQIAKPGEISPAPTGGRTPASEWKMATRPVPDVESTPFAQSKSVNVEPIAKVNDRYHVAEAPSWAPDRPGSETGLNSASSDGETTQPPPTWAPTR